MQDFGGGVDDSTSDDENEKRRIIAIGGTVDNPILTLDSPLAYRHYAAVDMYGDEAFEQRAEVGLLTRNIVYRGDPETSQANKWGAHIMMHSPGDESSIGRIEYAQFYNVG